MNLSAITFTGRSKYTSCSLKIAADKQVLIFISNWLNDSVTTNQSVACSLLGDPNQRFPKISLRKRFLYITELKCDATYENNLLQSFLQKIISNLSYFLGHNNSFPNISFSEFCCRNYCFHNCFWCSFLHPLVRIIKEVTSCSTHRTHQQETDG